MSSTGTLRGDRRGQDENHDTLAGPTRHPAEAGRRGCTSPRSSARNRPSRSHVGLKSRGSEDVLLARTKAGEVVAIPGRRRGDRRRPFAIQLPGADADPPPVAGRGPDPGTRRRNRRPDEEVRAPGSNLPTALPSRAAGKTWMRPAWKVESPWGQEMKLPARGGHGRPVPWRSDDVSLGPRAQQGRGGAVLRPQVPLATATSTCWASP